MDNMWGHYAGAIWGGTIIFMGACVRHLSFRVHMYDTYFQGIIQYVALFSEALSKYF